MSGFLDRLFNRETKSARMAKERLQLVLIHDRVDLTSSRLDALKDDLIATISRYVDIDPDAVRINMEKGIAGMSVPAITCLGEVMK